jgi:hypothetical protein
VAREGYEVVIHEGPLPAVEWEWSAAEKDFLDLQSNPRRRREWAQHCHDARTEGMRRLGLKPRRDWGKDEK